MLRVALGRGAVSLAVLLAFVVTLVGGFLHPGYSHAADYISELGAVGAANGPLVSVAGFVPIGILIIAGLALIAPGVQARGMARFGYWLLLANGVSYIGAAVAPCDLGCPAVGSGRQAMHNLLGLLGYGVSGLGLLLLAGQAATGRSNRWITVALRIAGIVALGSPVLMGIPDLMPLRGLIQRIAECALFAALLLIAWRVAAGPGQAPRQSGR